MAKKLEAISLKDITPSSIASDQQIMAMNTALDSLLWSTTGDTRLVLLLARIDELSSDMLDMLAWQYHVDIYESEALPIEQKRSLVKNALLIHRYKGTRWAIRQTLLDLGFKDIKFYEWWEMGTAPHTFAMKVYPMIEEIVPKIKGAVNAMKPVRSEMTDLTLQLNHSEKLAATDLAFIRRSKILTDIYPWPENLYSGLDTPLKYLGAADRMAAQYSIYERTEELAMTLKVCIVDYMFAQHKYSDPAAAEHYYNGGIVYGADAELTDSVILQATGEGEMMQEALEAEDGLLGMTIKWIL